MVATELIAAAASATLVPTFAGPVLSKVPGGPIGALVVGAAMVYFGSKLNGVAKGVVVGAGAGLVVANVAALVLRPAATASA